TPPFVLAKATIGGFRFPSVMSAMRTLLSGFPVFRISGGSKARYPVRPDFGNTPRSYYRSSMVSYELIGWAIYRAADQPEVVDARLSNQTVLRTAGLPGHHSPC